MPKTIIAAAGLAELSTEDERWFYFFAILRGLALVLSIVFLFAFITAVIWGMVTTTIRDRLNRKQ